MIRCVYGKLMLISCTVNGNLLKSYLANINYSSTLTLHIQVDSWAELQRAAVSQHILQINDKLHDTYSHVRLKMSYY